MRLLADENVPRVAVEALRDSGHDVTWVRNEAAGSSDVEVLEQAAREDRLLVTLDKDFGELAFAGRLPASCGVLLVRTAPSSPSHVAETIVTALGSRTDWAGHFSVVEPGRVRMTPLPQA